jgi:hypothetical protein
LPEAIQIFVPLGKENRVVERKYILSMSTWDGVRYWGRLNLRISVVQPHKKRRFILSSTKASSLVVDNETVNHVKNVIFTRAEGKAPGADNFLSLCGKLEPAGVFQKIYAVHHELGIIFPGEITKNGTWYSIPDVMPGSYDLFLIGKSEIVFALSPPERKNLMDFPISENTQHFTSWLASGNTKRELLYCIGRQSNTKAIVAEEKMTQLVQMPGKILPLQAVPKRFLYLWLCSFRSGRWEQNNFCLLYEQDTQKALPALLLDANLANITLPLENGPQQYDYLAN